MSNNNSNAGKSTEASLKAQVKYLKETTTRLETELRNTHSKIKTLEDQLDINKQDTNRYKTDWHLAQKEVDHKNEEIKILKSSSKWKVLLRSTISVLVSLLLLFAGLLYSYAINKITGTPPDKGAEILINFAIFIYIIASIIQLINSGGRS